MNLEEIVSSYYYRNRNKVSIVNYQSSKKIVNRKSKIVNQTMEIINENQKDPQLWRIAQKRASFKRHLITYAIVNAMLWCIYFFSHRWSWYGHWGIPWPAWVTLFWGIGLAFNYIDAYHGSETELAEREYEKLKQEREKKQ
ncbi:MAG: 2TM domain-containing protein [Bacteroidia bacterium]